MQTLPRFLIRHALIGFALAILLVGLALIFDLLGLRGLAAASRSGPVAIGVLAFSLGLTFASVQMGMAVMLLGRADDPDSGKARPIPTDQARPIPATLRNRRRTR